MGSSVAHIHAICRFHWQISENSVGIKPIHKCKIRPIDPIDIKIPLLPVQMNLGIEPNCVDNLRDTNSPDMKLICFDFQLFNISYYKRWLSVQLHFWVTVMLVTSLCRWLYDGDWFQMLVAESLCWRLYSLCWRFTQCIKSVTNILNRSTTYLVSSIRHQHRCNPLMSTIFRISLKGSFEK